MEYIVNKSLPRSVEEIKLIAAYKQKMERNHARQDGTADTDKGYV